MKIQEKAVEIAKSYLAKNIREVGGNNRGKWVEYFLRYVGLGAGYPWCSAFVSTVLGEAGFDKFKSAAVISWRNWAREEDRITSVPEPGMLAYYLNSNGTGHIGIVVEVKGNKIYTIEGNTSPGTIGSQRDGDGAYPRERSLSFWTGKGGFIKWYDGVESNDGKTPIPPTIKLGSKGGSVERWQKILGIPVDGVFGRQTQLATKLWQNKHGLDPDGEVGPLTWGKALEEKNL